MMSHQDINDGKPFTTRKAIVTHGSFWQAGKLFSQEQLRFVQELV